MIIRKKTLLRLSKIAHVVVAVTLCDLTSSVIRRVILLVCIGVIGGIQCICLQKLPDDTPTDKKAETFETDKKE